jgi:hypothetical protein
MSVIIGSSSAVAGHDAHERGFVGDEAPEELRTPGKQAEHGRRSEGVARKATTRQSAFCPTTCRYDGFVAKSRTPSGTSATIDSKRTKHGSIVRKEQQAEGFGCPAGWKLVVIPGKAPAPGR